MAATRSFVLTLAVTVALFSSILASLPFIDYIPYDQIEGFLRKGADHQGHDQPSFNELRKNHQEMWNPNAPRCNWQTFQSCYTSFLTNAGLASNITHAPDLNAAVNNKLRQGNMHGGVAGTEAALAQICRAQQKMYGSCLGQTMAGQCVNAIAYLQNGASGGDAYGFQMAFTSLNFQCGVAYTSFLPNAGFYFVANVLDATSLATCVNNYIQSLNASHGANLPLQWCSAMETYSECVGKVYYQVTTPKNLDFGWANCESARLRNIITLPMCTSSQWACKLANLQSP